MIASLKNLIPSMTIGMILLLPTLVLAQQTVTTFQSLPFIEGENLSTQAYMAMLYRLAIAAAAFIVIFKIIMAGAALTFTDSVSGRSQAKKDIFAALLGMLIILGAVTILNTINPNLTNLNFLTNAEPTVVNSTNFPVSSQVISAEKQRVLDEGLSVSSVYSGQFGTTEHLNFLRDCGNTGGTPIGYPEERRVDCYK